MTNNRFLPQLSRSVLWLALLACAVSLVPSRADDQHAKSPRGVMVQDLRNDAAPFLVRIDVDSPTRNYRGGDVMRINVVSEEDGYLYLLYLSADNKVSCLFPNHVQSDNRIAAHQRITVPGPGAEYVLRVTPPFGEELLKAIVTKTYVDPATFGVESFTTGAATALQANKVKDVSQALNRDRTRWAEHHVHVVTVAPDARVLELQPPKPRRMGLFVGISQYSDSRIRNLRVSHRDAEEMARIMRQYCQLDDVVVLVNEQATLSAIRTAFLENLVQTTKPGDKVFIFWSGHGGRCADDTGLEPDGFSEYLVPHDGRIDDLTTTRQTMLLDRTFGRWVQELDGRRVVVIIDTCYAAGQAAGQKGVGPPVEQQAEGFLNNFMDAILIRAKNIGQQEAAVLAASRAAQVAFERRDRDLSVMTYFLAQKLENASAGVTLVAAYEHLNREVPAYVERVFPGVTQTPVLADETTPPVYLRP